MGLLFLRTPLIGRALIILLSKMRSDYCLTSVYRIAEDHEIRALCTKYVMRRCLCFITGYILKMRAWRAWRLPGRWPDGGRRSTVARWTRRRAAPSYAPIPDLTCSTRPEKFPVSASNTICFLSVHSKLK